MTFAEKLKTAREEAGLSQKELAERAGIHHRSIQNWESGSRLPRSLDIVFRLSEVLGVSSESLLNDSDKYIIKADEKGGAKAAHDVDELVSEVIGLFAGGDLDEDEKDGIMAALNEAYWVAKQKNSRFTPKKYKKPSPDEKQENDE